MKQRYLFALALVAALIVLLPSDLITLSSTETLVLAAALLLGSFVGVEAGSRVLQQTRGYLGSWLAWAVAVAVGLVLFLAAFFLAGALTLILFGRFVLS